MNPPQQHIFRAQRTANFTIIPNALLRDRRLSYRARGIMAMILSNHDAWEVHQGWVQEQGTEGREAVSSAFRELEEHGYAVHSVERERGQIVRCVWTFWDAPVAEGIRSNRTKWKPEDGKPCNGKPPHGLPSDGKSATKKDNETEDHQQNADCALFPEFAEPAPKPKPVKLTTEQWVEQLKRNPAYQHIDFEVEIGKMRAFLELPKNKGRQLTQGFLLNWINRIERPIGAVPGTTTNTKTHEDDAL